MNQANPFAPPPPPNDLLAQLKLGDEQAKALDQVRAWLRSPALPHNQVFRLFGYAGTGKTTLARALAAEAKGRVVFGAYTGKAASVLKQKGCEGAATLHSLIYKPVVDADQKLSFVRNEDSELLGATLLIIDEVSMVNKDLGRELLSFHCKILVLGDPEQLPPVTGGGFFTDQKPDVMLTKIHRQAADNPIVRLAHRVRHKQKIEFGDEHSEAGTYRVVSGLTLTVDDVLAADQILVGTNELRHRFNRRARELLGRRDPQPVRGDKLVCLKNNRPRGLYNGEVWYVAAVLPSNHDDQIHLSLTRSLDDDAFDTISVAVHQGLLIGAVQEDDLSAKDKKRCELFDYGYALTVHKAQGSQWDLVLLFDESSKFGEIAHRWLYTGVTRAAHHLTVVQL